MLGAQVRDRLSPNEEETNKFDLERFNIKKPNYVEINKHYQAVIEKMAVSLKKNVRVMRTLDRLEKVLK